ncbi:hypothetical protein C8Q73DRAFT_713781 [Cubamyces lactineus]|nr:hypothetical protein C8Q73DRAFT_713781 [Cubamyces lactineus]
MPTQSLPLLSSISVCTGVTGAPCACGGCTHHRPTTPFVPVPSSSAATGAQPFSPVGITGDDIETGFTASAVGTGPRTVLPGRDQFQCKRNHTISCRHANLFTTARSRSCRCMPTAPRALAVVCPPRPALLPLYAHRAPRSCCCMPTAPPRSCRCTPTAPRALAVVCPPRPRALAVVCHCM